MARTARSYRTAGAEPMPRRTRNAPPATHPSTPRAEYERGGAMRLVLAPEREAPVTAALLALLAEVTAEVEAGEVTTRVAHKLTTAVKLAGELAAKRLEMSPQNP
jgi:hypothetical protein